MDSRWIGIIIFLLVIITAVSFLRPRGERQPEVVELHKLELGDERVVRIMGGQLRRDRRQLYYYQVEQGGEVVAEPAFFGSLPVGSPLFDFQWHETPDGSLVGFVAAHRPREVLFLYDFETGESWPAHDGSESADAFQARGQAMFEPLAEAHADGALALRHGEYMRPLAHPPDSPYLDEAD